MFESVKVGYLWLKIDDQLKPCLQTKINKVPVSFSGDVISDFVSDINPSFYDIPYLPEKTFRIDASAKILKN